MQATKTTTVRMGVIGVGRIGRMHAEPLAHRIPGASLTWVQDLHEESARKVADTHADLIVADAQAGKAIVCEKPMSLDLAEVDRALAAVDAAGVPFSIGFNRRLSTSRARAGSSST